MSEKICFLIDDDPDELEIFNLALTEWKSNIHVVYVSDPVVALKKLQAREIVPDYIFLDVNMPRLNGWECLQQIDEIEYLSDVPVAMYSTSLPSELPVKVTNIQTVSLIKKPSAISELRVILQHYFSTQNL